MSDGGKGDKQRPLAIPEEQFNKNWDNIFKRPAKQKEKPYESDYVKNVKLAAKAGEEG
jgi:TorA maturation chaperone TorD